jgi:hypothetical protein
MYNVHCIKYSRCVRAFSWNRSSIDIIFLPLVYVLLSCKKVYLAARLDLHESGAIGQALIRISTDIVFDYLILTLNI